MDFGWARNRVCKYKPELLQSTCAALYFCNDLQKKKSSFYIIASFWSWEAQFFAFCLDCFVYRRLASMLWLHSKRELNSDLCSVSKGGIHSLILFMFPETPPESLLWKDHKLKSEMIYSLFNFIYRSFICVYVLCARSSFKVTNLFL